MKVVITADSTCDLPQEIIEQREIVITPLTILLGEKSYLDSLEVHPSDIYEFVEKTANFRNLALNAYATADVGQGADEC